MPIKKTVMQIYDSYGSDFQIPYEDWPRHWDGIKRYLGASLFNDSLTVTVTGGEEDGSYTIREIGEPFVISQHWTLMEIEEYTQEELDDYFADDYDYDEGNYTKAGYLKGGKVTEIDLEKD